MDYDTYIIGPDDQILVTGASGFIGRRVVRHLLDYGFRKVRCFVRPSADPARVKSLSALCRDGAHVEIMSGNLLRREECAAAAQEAAGILVLICGPGGEGFFFRFLEPGLGHPEP